MTQPKITLNQLKQHLRNCAQEELITDVAELFKRFPSVKEYYQIKLYPQSEPKVLAKYKKTIEDEFFPARGFGKARLSIAKKAISDYRKVCDNEVAARLISRKTNGKEWNFGMWCLVARRISSTIPSGIPRTCSAFIPARLA